MPANRFNGFSNYGVGIGMPVPHYDHVLAEKPVVDWFEIISENYMVDDGRALQTLDQILDRYRGGSTWLVDVLWLGTAAESRTPEAPENSDAKKAASIGVERFVVDDGWLPTHRPGLISAISQLNTVSSHLCRDR
jgi:hypothetical protein